MNINGNDPTSLCVNFKNIRQLHILDQIIGRSISFITLSNYILKYVHLIVKYFEFVFLVF